MQLSATQRKYLLNDQIIGGAIFNFVLNTLLAWLTFRRHEVVPLKGDQSIVANVLGIAIILPLLSCVIVTPLVRKAIQAGKVEPLQQASTGRTVVLWLPKLSLLRGLVLSLLSLAWAAPLVLAVLVFAGVASMSVGGFVFVNGLYAAAISAGVSPIVALYVLASAEPMPGVSRDAAAFG
jgi:hypothetical protein